MVRLVTFRYCLLIICTLQQSIGAKLTVLPHQVPHDIEGVTYESLKDVFQSYPIDRTHTDQSVKFLRSCDGVSGHREIIHADAGQVSWRVTKPCYSVLQNCRYDISMESLVRFCLSVSYYVHSLPVKSNPSVRQLLLILCGQVKLEQHRRYEYMEYGYKLRYGRNIIGKCASSKFERYFNYGPFYPCVCDCESSEKEADRYFSLIDVVSDDDKVVTDFRFRLIDHAFHIQIQQAQLGHDKLIRDEPNWKDVRTLSRWELLSTNVSVYYNEEGNDDTFLKFHENDLVYAVTSQQNTILLDDLEGRENEVLTGLRFRQVGQDLRLEIRVTPFDHMTANLDVSASRWLHNDIEKSKRKEVKLPSTKVSVQSNAMSIISQENQFIRFQVSDFKTDLGQTTVPFIATVGFNNPQSLRGAGIFYKGSADSAGFLGLKGIL